MSSVIEMLIQPGPVHRSPEPIYVIRNRVFVTVNPRGETNPCRAAEFPATKDNEPALHSTGRIYDCNRSPPRHAPIATLCSCRGSPCTFVRALVHGRAVSLDPAKSRSPAAGADLESIWLYSYTRLGDARAEHGLPPFTPCATRRSRARCCGGAIGWRLREG
jgi:hypothetical protein